ncbi:MAG: LPS-assembly protein LptD, partial [Mesorhizobium sp.]
MPSNRQARLARLYAATALACVLACVVPKPAFAQDVGDMATSVPSGSQMLLAADTLVYNNDNQTVTAVGGVQIDYGGNRLVAQRVEYNRNTKRMVASGNVEVVNSDGTKINSEHID